MLQSRYIQALSTVMVGIMLMASFGLVVNKMQCNMSGRTVYSLTPIDDCCPDTPNAALLPHCCEFSQVAFQLDHEALTEKLQLVVSAWDWVAPVTTLLAEVPSVPLERVWHATDLPPPDSGWTLRILFQSFRN